MLSLSVVTAPSRGFIPCRKKQRVLPWANGLGRPGAVKNDAKGQLVYAGLGVGTEELTAGSTMVKAMDYSMMPLSLFDRATFDLFIPLVFVFPAPTPSNEALKEGLRRAVAAYPQLAGRLVVDQRGRRSIHVNNQGVLVQEAAASVDLADVHFVVDGRVVSDIGAMYPRLPQPEESIGSAVLQIKLTRYRCGGLVLGLSIHHQLGDGTALDGFLATWTRAVRQGTDFTAPSPLLDRGIHTAGVHPEPVFDHGSIEFKASSAADDRGTCRDMKTVMVSFTPEFIAELKARVGFTCTTFQCLLAHMWKKTTLARGLNPEEFTQVRVAVNSRGRARPIVPYDYFGNMVLWAFPRLQAGDLLGLSYGGVVGAIRDALARVDHEYVQSFVDFGRLTEDEELVRSSNVGTAVLCPDVQVTSWLGFRLHQLDFGTGPPSAFLRPEVALEGHMCFVPSTMAEGAVDLRLVVMEDQVAAFKNTCYSLDDISLPSSRM